MKLIPTLILIAASACLTSARAQNDSEPANIPSVSACPTALEMDQQHLQGTWRAQLTGSTAPGADALDANALGTTASANAVLLQLGPHPELTGSVRGSVQRSATTSQITGDVHLGELALEESNDGQRISATWIGEVVDGRCGQEIRGTWHSVSPATTIPFVLRKQIPSPHPAPL